MKVKKAGLLILECTFLLLLLYLCLTSMSLVRDFRLSRDLDWKTFISNPFSQNQKKKLGLPRYELFIKDKHLNEINLLCEAIRDHGFLAKEHKIWFPATFKANNKTYQVKIRIRGDLEVHWRSRKKSWRIRFNKNNPFEGQREINLIVPEDKGINEMVYGVVADQLTIMRPRDKLVICHFNNDYFGLYRQVEHFNNEMLAAQNKTETAIISSQNHFSMNKSIVSGIPDFTYPQQWMPIYNKNYLDDNPYTQKAMQAFEQLCQLVTDRERDNVNDIFLILDKQKYLDFQILIALSGTLHGNVGFGNAKLYFNAQTGKFEPIMWDVKPTQRVYWAKSLDTYRRYIEQLHCKVVENREIELERNRKIFKFLNENNLATLIRKNFFNSYDLNENQLSQFPLGKSILKELKRFIELLNYNAKEIEAILSYNAVNIQVRPDLKNPHKLILEISPEMTSGILVDSFQIKGTTIKKISEILTESSQPVAFNKSYLPSGRQFMTSNNSSGEWFGGSYFESYVPVLKNYTYELLLDVEAKQLSPDDFDFIFYNAVTGKRIKRKNIRFYQQHPHHFDLKQLNPKVLIESMTQHHPTLSLNPKSREIIFPAGTYRLKDDLIVPADHQVILQPGVEFICERQASFISFSPVQARGTKDSPITFHPPPDQEKSGVFAVVHQQKSEASVFEHMHFRQGSSDIYGYQFFSGMLSVYYGQVKIKYCHFVQAIGEDALNVKYSNLNLEKSFFYKNTSDALDADFSTGLVSDCQFKQNLGDAVDFSSGTFLVRRNRFSLSGDKGLSAGEGTELNVQQNAFIRNIYGAAVKDRSHVIFKDNIFSYNKTAIANYIKKPHFGSGKSILYKNSFFQNQNDFFQDQKSEVVKKEIQIKIKNKDELKRIFDQKNYFSFGLMFDHES